MSALDDVKATLDHFEAKLRNVGKSAEEEPNGYAVDLHTTLCDGYFEGTGYLPSKKVAEALAAMLLPGLQALSETWKLLDPNMDLGFPLESWAYIVSAERDEWDEPVYEEIFHGDAWFVAGAAMPHTLTDEERALLDEVRAALERQPTAEDLDDAARTWHLGHDQRDAEGRATASHPTKEDT